MPLYKIQSDILRLLASHRDLESDVVGASTLNRDVPRYSGDIDVFHGREERAAAAAASDAQTLEQAGYSVRWVRRDPTVYTAKVTGPSGATHLEWVVDSEFAPHKLQGGRKRDEQIDEAIRLYQKLLLVLSPASMISDWVKTEIANARIREKQENRKKLFPITIASFDSISQWKCFDADIGIDSAREIREYFIPDFSNWKDHDSCQRAFQRLLTDLQATARRASV